MWHNYSCCTILGWKFPPKQPFPPPNTLVSWLPNIDPNSSDNKNIPDRTYTLLTWLKLLVIWAEFPPKQHFPLKHLASFFPYLERLSSDTYHRFLWSCGLATITDYWEGFLLQQHILPSFMHHTLASLLSSINPHGSDNYQPFLQSYGPMAWQYMMSARP